MFIYVFVRCSADRVGAGRVHQECIRMSGYTFGWWKKFAQHAKGWLIPTDT